MIKRCAKCGESKQLADFNKDKKTKDGHYYWCRKCDNESNMKRSRAKGHLPMSENKRCSVYLGVAIAERLIRHLFTDVQRMPYGNPGFDFICNKGKKIDVKSSCITLSNKKNPYWQFGIDNNQIADHFLLLAFNDRDDLEPLHQWLVPACVLNRLKGNAYISPSTINKWDEWRQPIGPAISCCNTIKNGGL